MADSRTFIEMGDLAKMGQSERRDELLARRAAALTAADSAWQEVLDVWRTDGREEALPGAIGRAALAIRQLGDANIALRGF